MIESFTNISDFKMLRNWSLKGHFLLNIIWASGSQSESQLVKLCFGLYYFRLYVTLGSKIFQQARSRKISEKHCLKQKTLTSLLGSFFIEVVDPGLEPGTHGFSIRCSTNWANPPQLPALIGSAKISIILFNPNVGLKKTKNYRETGNYSPKSPLDK